jgi:hypothetical protein
LGIAIKEIGFERKRRQTPTSNMQEMLRLLSVVLVSSLQTAARTPPTSPQQVRLFTPAVVEANLTQNMVRTAGRAVKTAAPVLVPEQPWERSLFFYHSVIQVGPEMWLYVVVAYCWRQQVSQGVM